MCYFDLINMTLPYTPRDFQNQKKNHYKINKPYILQTTSISHKLITTTNHIRHREKHSPNRTYISNTPFFNRPYTTKPEKKQNKKKTPNEQNDPVDALTRTLIKRSRHGCCGSHKFQDYHFVSAVGR